MEKDVTKIVQIHLGAEVPARYLSGSVAELGDTAVDFTWGNALRLSESLDICPADDEETAEAIVDHLRRYGDWEDEELANYSPVELGAFLVQEVAHEIRHLESEGLDLLDFTEEEYTKATENEGGRLFGGAACVDPSKWFYYLGE